MKIYTGNYANLKKYEKVGLYPVGISLTAKYFSGVSYKILAPDWSFKNDEETSYTIKFNQKLSKLDKDKVKKDLSMITQNKDVVLLCHEKYGDFCHRHLVNDWLNGNGEFLEKKIIKEKQTELF